jgi:hypothetical protein
MILVAHFAFDIRVPSLSVYMLYAVLVMIIVLEPCYEIMNHYVLSHHCLSSCFMYLLHILHIFILIVS